MPARRKPSNVLELKGAFKKDPQRRRKAVKAPEGPFGAPPARFDDEQRACWDEVLELIPPAILARADRVQVELLATLLAEFRQAYYAFPAQKIGHLRLCLGALGMTPESREKFNRPDEEAAPDRFAEFG
jgi:hypothetical protein